MKPHIFRNSESNNSPLLVEKTQGGMLIRFDIKEVQREETTMFAYKEFWFDLATPNIEQVVTEHGFELTQTYKDLLI